MFKKGKLHELYVVLHASFMLLLVPCNSHFEGLILTTDMRYGTNPFTSCNYHSSKTLAFVLPSSCLQKSTCSNCSSRESTPPPSKKSLYVSPRLRTAGPSPKLAKQVERKNLQDSYLPALAVVVCLLAAFSDGMAYLRLCRQRMLCAWGREYSGSSRRTRTRREGHLVPRGTGGNIRRGRRTRYSNKRFRAISIPVSSQSARALG